MKMMNQMKQLKHNSFSVRESEMREVFETQKDFGLARYNTLLYSIKKNLPGNFYARNEYEKRINGFEKIVMKKLRIFKVKSVFDSITFSSDFLDTIEEVLSIFDAITNSQIFDIIDDKYYSASGSKFRLPHWFKPTSLNSFASWIVAHFEKRIYLCFREGEPTFENRMPIQVREEYVSVWTSLGAERQEELISKVVDQLDHFREEAFSGRMLVPNYKEARSGARSKHSQVKGDAVIRNMNWDEVMLKLIWTLTSERDRLAHLSFDDLKESIKNKIVALSQTPKSFIFMCVSPNLVDSMKVEKFFMNRMVQYLHDLYIQKNIDDLEKEEQKKKGRNKRKNKRSKRNKKRRKNRKRQEEKEEKIGDEKNEIQEPAMAEPGAEEMGPKEEEPRQVMVELVEQPTMSESNRDEFMIRLRRQIAAEGDKKGLLVPLLSGEKKQEEGDKKTEQAEEDKEQAHGGSEAQVELVVEKIQKRQHRAKALCEIIHKLLKEKKSKKQRDTKSLCEKEQAREATNTIEEDSDYLYRSVRTTGMEAFWDDCKTMSMKSDSFFFSKDKRSDQKSDAGFGRLSKGGFSFGCRSQSGKEKDKDMDCRSEGSKVMSGKVKSFRNLLEIETLKIEEDIELETEIASPKFEIEVPLKMVEPDDKKEPPKEKAKKRKRRKQGEKRGKARAKDKKEGTRGEAAEQAEDRKSRSLCGMDKDKAEGPPKSKKRKKVKYKLKKSKKDRKRRKEDKKGEFKMGPRREVSGKKEQPRMIIRKAAKKPEKKEEKRGPKSVSKATRGKVQKWEESGGEKLEKSQKKERGKTEKRPKPGKWDQGKQEKPLKLGKPKKRLRLTSNAFTFKPKQKLSRKGNKNKTSMPANPMVNFSASVNPLNQFGPFMGDQVVVDNRRSSLAAGAFSYEPGEMLPKGQFQSHSGMPKGTFWDPAKNSAEPKNALVNSNKDIERKSEEIQNLQNVTKSQRFFSRRELEGGSFSSTKFKGSLQLMREGSCSEKGSRKLTWAVEQEKERIGSLTREAFTMFVGRHIKKVVDELKFQAESLNEHRRIILNRINCIVHKSFKTTEVNVRPYGSYSTGLLTPFSDLDLALWCDGFKSISMEETKQYLNTLENNLRLFSFVKETKKILTATIPVIKIVADASIEYNENPEKATESRLIKVDIIVGSCDENGETNSAFRSTEYVSTCIRFYPSFFDLALFFKFVLSSNHLANAFTGGLNAYGLSILLVAFLHQYSYENCTDIGLLALEFLNFLSNSFNPQYMGVRLTLNEYVCRQPFVPLKSLLIYANLVIMDPTTTKHRNVTPSCFRVFQVLQCLREGFFHIRKACDFMEHKLLRKLEETLNRSVSDSNRFYVLKPFSKNVPSSDLSKSIPDHRFSLNDNKNHSLLLSNGDAAVLPLNPSVGFPGLSEVLSQDVAQKNKLGPAQENKFGPLPVEQRPVKSLRTKSEIKFAHSNTTSPLSKTEETTQSPSQQIPFNLKRKNREIELQMANLTDFTISKGDLLQFFEETYADLLETSFKLNFHCPEDESGCESVVHEKLQTDMNFDAKRKRDKWSRTWKPRASAETCAKRSRTPRSPRDSRRSPRTTCRARMCLCRRTRRPASRRVNRIIWGTCWRIPAQGLGRLKWKSQRRESTRSCLLAMIPRRIIV